MCEPHRRATCAFASTNDPSEAIGALEAQLYLGVTVWREDEPIAVAGAILTHPNVASAFMFGTDRWQEVETALTEFFRSKLFPSLKTAGLHRVQSITMAGDPLTEAWMQHLLGAPEATLRAYGKGKEDFTVRALDLSEFSR
jgi:hypothetical protein